MRKRNMNNTLLSLISLLMFVGCDKTPFSPTEIIYIEGITINIDTREYGQHLAFDITLINTTDTTLYPFWRFQASVADTTIWEFCDNIGRSFRETTFFPGDSISFELHGCYRENDEPSTNFDVWPIMIWGEDFN